MDSTYIMRKSDVFRIANCRRLLLAGHVAARGNKYYTECFCREISGKTPIWSTDGQVKINYPEGIKKASFEHGRWM
jgi:hypothetical protein